MGVRQFLQLSLVAAAHGQQFLLSNVHPPVSHALSTVARFFMYGKPTGKVDGITHPTVYPNSDEYMPAFGWGFWDRPYALPAKIVAQDLGYIVNDPRSSMDRVYLDLAVMEYDTFWGKFLPHQASHHFCCTKRDVENGQCEEEHAILLPPELKQEVFLVKIPVGKATLEGSEADFHIPKSGIYFLMVVNCGINAPDGQFRGVVTARGAHGYLSGMDVPKIQLYAIGILCYAALGLFWLIWIIRYHRQLILLHHLIGCVITLSLIEQVMWYFSLSWSNYTPEPSNIIVGGAIMISVVRNVSTCLLILLASLGLCITRPSLERSTKAKLWAGCIALFALDGTRQLATQFHVSLDLSMMIVMICTLPITFLYSGGFMWAFYSLNALIEELKNRRQTAKFRQMSRYRCVLTVASLCFVGSTLVELYILSRDVSKVWHYEWIFTDAVPNVLFSFILALTAILWRPTRSSKYYSYNLQIPDSDPGETLDIDRIRADIHGKAFEVTFDSPSTTGVPDNKAPEIRAWGEIDLDLEDDEEVTAGHQHGRMRL
eukprot:Blabericola_migrator_1__9857@NODE_542_length_7732_cov_201_153033_g409_i0_p1_GENE_NODE_542_length_7732_cov_201_153033_g409_i0NODE_542_length_7732_cov_201_153033_g409_i0_p1_ORF_typecomplete_len543_score59_13Lung_7TM_R/PF06814_13/1_3e54GpcrRhopsn4/PF10192_9/0_062_NODE_542_length_7732_cov_201_153033_g409_i033154943